MHFRLLSAPALVLLAATTGCATSASIWDTKEACLKNPSAYAALPPERSAFTESGLRAAPAPEPAELAMSVERRSCDFHVQVTSRKGTASFGPYDSIDTGSIMALPATGRYAFIAQRGTDDTRVIIDGTESPPHRSIKRPVISLNGRHIAYLASDGDNALLSLDGKTIASGSGSGAPVQLMAVLDDGRAAFTRISTDGRTELVAGQWTSQPFDELRYFTAWRNIRFTVSLRHGTKWEAVIDGRAEPLQGEPTNEVLFSTDGAHSMYFLYRGDASTRRFEAMIDGVSHTLPDNGGNLMMLHWWGEAVPIAQLEPTRSTGNKDAGQAAPGNRPMGSERAVFFIGQKAPGASPPADDYTVAHRGRDGMFVDIGGSRGPQFEHIVPESLRIDERGRVHYRGVRKYQTYDVIDNEIQMLELVTAPLKTPQVASSAPPVEGAQQTAR